MGITVANGESLVYDARDWDNSEPPSLLNEVPLEDLVYLAEGNRLLRMTTSEIKAFTGPFARIAITHMVPVLHTTESLETSSSDVPVGGEGKEELYVVVPLPHVGGQGH